METLVKNIFKRKTSDDLVREIHNEFDTAGDKLLKQAQDILEKIALESKDEALKNKAKIMNDIGFTNSKFVIDINSKIEKDKREKDKAEKNANLVMYYKEKYPNLKFLNETDLDTICKKYNLVYAPVKNYIENVPDKNLNDILQAQELDVVDTPDNKYYYTDITTSASINKDMKAFINSLKIEVDKRQFSKPEEERVGIKRSIDITSLGYDDYRTRQTFNAAMFVSKFLRDNYSKYDIDAINSMNISLSKVEVERGGLFICAPKKHFNLENLSKDKKYGFFEKMTTQIIEVKDPIVFRYVKGGIQVITKWGIEAEDKLLND